MNFKNSDMQKNFLISILILLSFNCLAQLNFSAGFTYGRTINGVNNDIIDKVNENNSSLINYEGMKKIGGLYGFHFGTQFRFDVAAISLNWDNKVQAVSYTHLTLPTTPYV